MPKIGLDKLTIWEVTKDDSTGLTYGAPSSLGKAIKADVKPKKVDGELFGDDALVESYSAVTGYDLTFNVTDLPPEIKAKVLGYKVDANGMVELSPNANAPYFAIAYRSALSTGGYSYHNLLKVRFEPMDDTSETKGQNINYQTPTITAKAMATENSGIFGFDVRGTAQNKVDVEDKWFAAKPVVALKG